MTIVRKYVVEVPVTIEAADEPSLAAAKQHLKGFFSRSQAGANHNNLVFRVDVDSPRLTTRDINDD